MLAAGANRSLPLQNHSDDISPTAAPTADHDQVLLQALLLCFSLKICLAFALGLRCGVGLLDGITDRGRTQFELDDALLQSLAIFIGNLNLVYPRYLVQGYLLACACLHLCFHLALISLISHRPSKISLQVG